LSDSDTIILSGDVRGLDSRVTGTEGMYRNMHCIYTNMYECALLKVVQQL